MKNEWKIDRTKKRMNEWMKELGTDVSRNEWKMGKEKGNCR